VLCPGRRTVTRMIGVGEHAHDAYHRLLRAGAWTMTRLWRRVVALLVVHLDLDELLVLDLDDTLFHKQPLDRSLRRP
jgi:DDE superfamily endonuclease